MEKKNSDSPARETTPICKTCYLRVSVVDKHKKKCSRCGTNLEKESPHTGFNASVSKQLYLPFQGYIQ